MGRKRVETAHKYMFVSACRNQGENAGDGMETESPHRPGYFVRPRVARRGENVTIMRSKHIRVCIVQVGLKRCVGLRENRIRAQNSPLGTERGGKRVYRELYVRQ